jgi:hypothetical protein
MKTEKPLELLPQEEQIQKLRAFLHPYRSRLRPLLTLFAVKNHLLREDGLTAKNDPTVRWYQDRLINAGLTASRWSVQHQLDELARFGVVDKTMRTMRVLREKNDLASLIRAEVCEYRLNEAIYPALEQALKQLLGVDSFFSITGLDDP